MLYRLFRAMNTTITLGAECPYPDQVFDMAQESIERYEARFTRFKETSELSALNRAGGEWFSVSPDMLELLIAAAECHQATNGIFDPSILLDLQAVGYTQSFDQLCKHGASPARSNDSLAQRITFSAMEIDALRGRVRLPKGMQIDLGGIAKGWIAERIARLMALSCTACAVNAGGDMFLMDQPSGQTAWEIGLEDPHNPVRDLMVLRVEGGAVATSSVVKRAWRQGETPQHHLIDPRTGKPAETPWLCVTVFAPKAVQAETFAKAILIVGPEHAQSLLDNNPSISFIAVDVQNQIWKSPTEVEKIYEYA
jgi:thiamine biosynthesis lipoprotein